MSNGSVIPRFMDQIQRNLPVTITDRDMSRFMMSIDESVKLVIDSLALMQGGEVFVMQMPVIRVGDLADVLIEELAPKYGGDAKNYPVKITGARPGEKLYEELTTDEEIPRSFEFDNFIVVMPALRNIYGSIDFGMYERTGNSMEKSYHSHNETSMTKDEIRAFLQRLNIIEK
jgi:FlaA1/EpsC-like NDP-sugar epimerase